MFLVRLNNHPMCTLCTDVVDTNFNNNQLSRDQTRFLNFVSTSIRHLDNQHYEIALPVRNSEIQLPLNRTMAEQRACYLKRKFLKNPAFFEHYKTFVNDMLVKNYAERVEGVKDPPGKTWYIPHHGVYHPNKPQKIRVVFDCSAKYKGISLNDTLLAGPDITNKLLGVLIRFRSEVIAIEGDIKSMFHQIQIPPRDRDKLRFLWWENGELSNALIEYRMCVYLFGTVCSPSCANFALKQTAVDFKGNFDHNAVDVINNCFYVDDCLASSPFVKEAKRLLKEVSELLMKGGFKITKWVSNSREVIRTVPKSDRSTNLQNQDLCSADLPKERALGLWWDAEKDTLCFRVQVKTKPLTRRGILSVVNSIYDPLGFGAPVIQPMKLLLQSLCKIKLKWDDPIPSSYNTQYLQWIDQLPSLDAFQVARCYKTLGFGKLKQAAIHHFADASEKSYGCASYLRLVDGEDNINVFFLLGKTRLVPLKTITVPRLELCAATISVRLDQCLRRELNPVLPPEPSLF